MNKITKFTQSQLTRALGLNPGYISMAKKRGKVHIDEEGLIDIKHPINDNFLRDQKDKGREIDYNKLFEDPRTKAAQEKKKKELSPQEKKVVKAINELKQLEIEQKKATLERTKKAIQLDEIKIKKQEGKLVPTDAVKTVFLFAVETFRKRYLQEVKSIANIFVSKVSAEHSIFIELQKDITRIVAEIQEEVKKDLLEGLDGIVEEYKEVRSRGEKK